MTASVLMICAFGIFIVINQDMIIFNLAASIDDDNRDVNSARRNIVKLMNANDTATFNEAVL